MKTLLLRIAKASGLFAVSRRLTRRGLRILCYHGIWLGDGHYGDFLFMSPEKFAARMDFLAKAGYPVLPLDQAVQDLAADKLPPCATAITIDDGWYGTFLHMVPALETHKLPATVYLTTYYAEHRYPVFNLLVRYLLSRTKARELDTAALGLPDGGVLRLDTTEARSKAGDAIIAYGDDLADSAARGAFGSRLAAALGLDYDDLVRRKVFHLMSLADAAEAARRGIDIQLHTHRHRMPVGDPAAIAQEIGDNRARLEPAVGRHLQHFCYPSGRYDRRVWPQLQELDIISATTIEQGLNFPGAPRLGLKRLLDGQQVDLIEFEAELSGFLELARRLRDALRKPAARSA